MSSEDRRPSSDLPGGISKARLTELYLPTTEDFVVVDVPEMQFVVIDGEGSPDGETFEHAVRWLFSVVYPIKRIAKQRRAETSSSRPSRAFGGQTTWRTSSRGTRTS